MTRPVLTRYKNLVVCEICKKEKLHHRPGGRFCSQRCRQVAKRASEDPVDAGLVSQRVDSEDIWYSDPRIEVVVRKLVSEGYCTYCHQRFGEYVSWKRRQYFLGEEVDHVIPKVLGGKITVPCCSLCNMIKGSLRFVSLADIQDYCLDKLLAGGVLSRKMVQDIKVERVCRVEETSLADVEIFISEEISVEDPPEDPVLELPQVQKRKSRGESFSADQIPVPRNRSPR